MRAREDIIIDVLGREYKKLLKKVDKAKNKSKKYLNAPMRLLEIQKETLSLAHCSLPLESKKVALDKLEKEDKELRRIIKMGGTKILDEEVEAQIEKDAIASELSMKKLAKQRYKK